MLWAKLCVPLPKFTWWRPKQCDCIWSKEAIRLNEVVRVKPWSFRITVIKKDTKRLPLPPHLFLCLSLYSITTRTHPRHTQRKDLVSIQQAHSYGQARKRILNRNQISCYLNLRPPSLKNRRSKFLLFKPTRVCGILLQQPQQTKALCFKKVCPSTVSFYSLKLN